MVLRWWGFPAGRTTSIRTERAGGAKGTMRHLFFDTPQSRARELKLILRSTHSLLLYYTPYLKNDGALRNLDLALIAAIADLQQFDSSLPNASPVAQHAREVS